MSQPPLSSNNNQNRFDSFIRDLKNHLAKTNAPFKQVTLDQIESLIFPSFASNNKKTKDDEEVAFDHDAAFRQVSSRMNEYLFLYDFLLNALLKKIGLKTASFFLSDDVHHKDDTGGNKENSFNDLVALQFLHQIVLHTNAVKTVSGARVTKDGEGKNDNGGDTSVIGKVGGLASEIHTFCAQVLREVKQQATNKSPSSAASSAVMLTESETKKLLSKVYHNPQVNLKLKRFIKAQDQARATMKTAMAELSKGKKTSHWIWYIFPQFLDPGRSSLHNTEYQIHGQIEAVGYLLHKDLGPRHRDLFSIIHKQLCEKAVPVCSLMSGEVDAKKLHHSASTFSLAVNSLVKKNDEVNGAIAAAVPEETWKAVRELHGILPSVIDAIQKNPYVKILPQGFKNCPVHDPIIVATWDKTESWF